MYTAINQVNENFAIDTVITLFNKSPIPKRILLVEDNLLNQKIAKIMLESLGCIVSVAENAETALANDLLSFDLIFMDIGLPIISGFDITRRIRADNQYQYIPIIAMTAHAFQSDKEACLESGMNDVITKPVMQEELAAMLKKWIPN
ncbi:MAG: Aerobic respiration control sensor protein ArcB [Legionellaceae bacterium]